MAPSCLAGATLAVEPAEALVLSVPLACPHRKGLASTARLARASAIYLASFTHTRAPEGAVPGYRDWLAEQTQGDRGCERHDRPH